MGFPYLNQRCYLVLLSSLVIFSLGLLMIFSTTSAESMEHDMDGRIHQAFFRQMVYAIFGISLGILMWKVGYEKVLRVSPIVLAVLTFMLVLVLIPGIGKEVNGSKRWLNVLGFSFQPSEFVKFFIPAFFIQKYLSLKKEKTNFKTFFKIAACVFLPMGLILIEPNNGTVATIGMVLFMLFFLMKVPFKYWGIPLFLLIGIGAIFASQLPYVKARLNVYLHPELDLKGKGHQPYQALIATGSGYAFGKGPGNSLQKMSYLPEAQNDYIAAVYGEEFGFFGMLFLILMYLLLLMGGWMIALHAPDKKAFLFAGIITLMITFQASLNLGVVSGLLPSTGLNLPLFSQGGTSLMVMMGALGVLVSIGTSATHLIKE